MFRIRELILVCVASTGLVFILGCPPPLPGCTDDSECDDGLYCNEEEVCANRQCIGGTDPCPHPAHGCNEEGDACLSDPPPPRCSPADTCDDGRFCTATDICSNGTCVGSGNPCPGQMCNESTDACVNCLVNADCEDGDPYTDDKCLNGECQYSRIKCPEPLGWGYEKGCYGIIDRSVPCPGPLHCPSADNPNGVLVVAKWTKREITYQVEGGRDIRETEDLQELYAEAATTWSDLIPLDIRPAEPGEIVDIAVQFCPVGSDVSSCDRLAEEDGMRYAGEATFPNADSQVRQLIAVPTDLEDEFQRNVLLAVILHELGHSLALLHSEDPRAIMYPVILADQVATGVELHADDVTRIQDLYGDRAGTRDPLEPILPEIPSNPDCVLPDPNGPDRDHDGLADTFEELVTRTDPDNSDTDNDGLLDGCEIEFGLDPNNPDGDEDGRLDRVEVIDGTPARTPVICRAPDGVRDDERVMFLDAAYFDELGFEEGGLVRTSNLRNGCSVDDVTIRRAEDPHCTVRMPRDMREELCIFQLSVAVPLRICGMTAPVVLDDFEREASVLFTDGRGTEVEYTQHEGSVVLQVVWSLDGFNDYKFVIARVPQSQGVGPGQSLVVDIWVDRPQVIEVGAKSSLPNGSKREDFLAFPLMPDSWKPEVSVPIRDRYELTEVDLVIYGKNNCEPTAGVCDPSEGTFWVDNLRLEATAEVLYDFEGPTDPRPEEGGQSKVVPHPAGSENHVLEFDWDFAIAPENADPFVVLLSDGISVGPCDRLIVDVKVSVPTTVRLEAKTPGRIVLPIVMDTRSSEMQPGTVEEIEISISTRYALGEIALVIERDLNEEPDGIVWMDNIRLIRGE